MDDMERLLGDHPFLDGMPAEQVRSLVPCASLAHFAPGEFLLREGDKALGSFLIIQGRVVLEIGRPGREPIRVQSVPRGDAIGWSWLLTPHRWHFDAVAVEETRAIALDGVKLRALCDADHGLGYELARRYLLLAHARVEAMRLQLADLYGQGRSL